MKFSVRIDLAGKIKVDCISIKLQSVGVGLKLIQILSGQIQSKHL